MVNKITSRNKLWAMRFSRAYLQGPERGADGPS
jgi:hypothetical protein